MARKLNNMAFLVVMVIAALLQSSAAQTRYSVGDALGWVVPPGGAAAYSTWAASKTFSVGDILVFNFSSGVHNVAEVTKADFDACKTGSPIVLISTSPANITLNKTGEHYFICTFSGHCGLGQALAINVSASVSSPAPQPSSSSPAPQPSTSTPSPVTAPTPASSPPAPQPSTSTPSPVTAPTPAPQATTPSPVSAPTPTPSRSPVIFIVGDVMGWTVPQNGNGAAAYQTWANGKNFMVGDILVFNYVNGNHDVAEMTKEAYESCNTTSILSLSTDPPTNITLTTSGQHYFTCTFSSHCSLGQKLAINVTGTSSATPPSSTATPPSTSTTPTTPSALSPGGIATPPTLGNSATSLASAGLFATFLSLVIALFLY